MAIDPAPSSVPSAHGRFFNGVVYYMGLEEILPLFFSFFLHFVVVFCLLSFILLGSPLFFRTPGQETAIHRRRNFSSICAPTPSSELFSVSIFFSFCDHGRGSPRSSESMQQGPSTSFIVTLLRQHYVTPSVHPTSHITKLPVKFDTAELKSQQFQEITCQKYPSP